MAGESRSSVPVLACLTREITEADSGAVALKLNACVSMASGGMKTAAGLTGGDNRGDSLGVGLSKGQRVANQAQTDIDKGIQMVGPWQSSKSLASVARGCIYQTFRRNHLHAVSAGEVPDSGHFHMTKLVNAATAYFVDEIPGLFEAGGGIGRVYPSGQINTSRTCSRLHRDAYDLGPSCVVTFWEGGGSKVFLLIVGKARVVVLLKAAQSVFFASRLPHLACGYLNREARVKVAGGQTRDTLGAAVVGYFSRKLLFGARLVERASHFRISDATRFAASRASTLPHGVSELKLAKCVQRANRMLKPLDMLSLESQTLLITQLSLEVPAGEDIFLDGPEPDSTSRLERVVFDIALDNPQYIMSLRSLTAPEPEQWTIGLDEYRAKYLATRGEEEDGLGDAGPSTSRPGKRPPPAVVAPKAKRAKGKKGKSSPRKFDESILGSKVSCWWEAEGAWFEGELTSFTKGAFTVTYFDGDTEVLTLPDDTVVFI